MSKSDKNKYTKPLFCPYCYQDKKLLALNPCRHWCCRDCITNSGKPFCPKCKEELICTDKHLEEIMEVRINKTIAYLSDPDEKLKYKNQSRMEPLYDYYTSWKFRMKVDKIMNTKKMEKN